MDLITMFGSRPPIEELKSNVRDYLQEKKTDLRSTNEQIKAAENQLATKEANRKISL